MSNFYGDHTGLNIAGFTQVELNPLPRVKLVAGIRVEQNSVDDTRDKVVPIFRTGINWQAADYTFLRASFGQGYRYPSIAEKYASTTIGSVKIFPNPYIEPESGWSAEAGIKQGVLLGETKGQADISVFMSQNINMIEYLFGNYPDPVTGNLIMDSWPPMLNIPGCTDRRSSSASAGCSENSTPHSQADIPIYILWNSTRRHIKILIYT